MTSGVLTVLISGSRSSGRVAHSFARERTDQEDPATAAQDTYFSILQKYNTIQRGHEYRHKPCTQ